MDLESLSTILRREETWPAYAVSADEIVGELPPEPTCPICKDTGLLRRDLPRMHPEFGKPVECGCGLFAERRRNRLFRSANLPDGYDRPLSAYRPTPGMRTAIEACRAWADGTATYPWLMLEGPFRTGKTGLAIGALRQRIERTNEPGLFITASGLLDRIRATFGPGAEAGAEAEVLELAKTIPLLVLDDLGAEHDTSWAIDRLTRLIDDRKNYSRGNLIVTTNYEPTNKPGQLAERVGERLVHRLIEISVVVHVDGPNLTLAQRPDLVGE